MDETPTLQKGPSYGWVPVVMLVGLLLAVILFPLSVGGGKSPGVGCVSNIKQVTTGLLIYAADFDDLIPTGQWQTAIQPYVKNPEVYTCPEIRKRGRENGYAMNETIAGKPLASFSHPAMTVAIFETSDLTGNLSLPLSRQVIRNHGGKPRLISSYLDGRARAVSSE